MVSTKKTSLGDVIVGKSGIRWKKKTSEFNRCIGKKLAGTAGPVHGGRYDKAFQQKFTDAVEPCAAEARARAGRKGHKVGM